MHYTFRHYLRHFPLRYYLSGGLFATPEQVGVFFLSSKACSVLLTQRQRVVAFEENIGDLPDAPPMLSRPDPGTATVRSFTSKLLSRNRLRGKTELLLLPDCTVNDLYFNVHLVPNLRESSVEGILESLAEEPRQVIGAWDEDRPFRWAVLDAMLKPIAGQLEGKHSQIVILGIPADYCAECELWTERQDAALLAIVPVPVACLAWFLKRVPTQERTAFLLLSLTSSLALAVIQDRKIILFRQYEEDVDSVNQELATLARQLSPDKEPYVCIWSWSPEEDPVYSEIQGLQLTGSFLQQIEGGDIVIQRQRAPNTSTRSPVALLSRWLAQEFK
jgi:hypothetical protein